jgi:hypothetical protein
MLNFKFKIQHSEGLASAFPLFLRGLAVGAVLGEPLDAGDDLGSEFDAPFSDVEALVIDLALPADDIEEAARDGGGMDGAILLDPFFKAALSAAVAEVFPFGHESILWLKAKAFGKESPAGFGRPGGRWTVR